jgi:hypothetical protein
MARLFRIAVLTLILALLIPVLLDRLSILNEYGHWEDRQDGEPLKPRSAYRAGLVRGKRAISGLAEHHRVMASDHDANNVNAQLVAASDDRGKVVVVAGERSQLYIFRKKKDRYFLKQVLWDGATNYPLSLAITENARYAVMMTGETTVIPGILNRPDSILRFLGRNLRSSTLPKPTLVIWDLEKEEKVQEIDTYKIGVASNDMLVTAGRALVMKRSFQLINTDLSGKKSIAEVYVKKPDSKVAYRNTQAAYIPLTRQILVKNGAQNNLMRYKVRDESRDKWWKFWSTDISLEKLPGDFLACPVEHNDCSLDKIFPAFEAAPDGKFFVIWRDNGMLEVYSLPNGVLLSKIKTPNNMSVAANPHLTIVDGTVYLTHGRNFSTGENEGRFWSWKPGDEQLRSHFLQCADYTRLLNNGYIATLGCADKGMELRLVALADNSRAQAFSQPLELK